MKKIKVCPKCGRANRLDAEKCYYCGIYFDGRKLDEQKAKECQEGIPDFLADLFK